MAKAKIKKNLNQLYKASMHRPLSSDKIALYPKVENYNGKAESEDTIANKSKYFLAQSKSNYNSPTNIRRLFITGEKVEIHYYSPMIIKGKPSTTYKKSVELSENLYEITNKMLNYSAEFARYSMEKSINGAAVEPDNYVIEGNGIGVVSNPWVCNNIEEIYFDWTLLASNEVAPFFQEYCTINWYTAFVNKTTSFTEIKNSKIIEFFAMFNSGGVKDLRNRYPRLKTIAMISRLNEIIPLAQEPCQGLTNLDGCKTTWYELNKQIIAQSGSLVLLGELNANLPKLNTDFIVKDSIYKFDKDRLKLVAESFKKRVEDYYRQRMYGGSTEQQEQTAIEEEQPTEVTNSLEKYLLELEASNDPTIINNAIIYATMGAGLSATELRNIFNSFTKQNKDRFTTLLGLNR